MTKKELHKNLESGKTMDELFHYTDGQDCLIYKAETFTAGGEIIYIPDIHLNEIPMDRPMVSSEEIEAVISVCYTGQDLVNECEGDVVLAERLFHYCDWQHPSSALSEVADGGEEDTAEPCQKARITIFQAPYASLMDAGMYLKMHHPTNPYKETVPAEYYLPVFSGDIDCPDRLPDDQEQRDQLILERVFSIFNNAHPAGYSGRSLSVGDVVCLEGRHYLCNALGFTPVTFECRKREVSVPGASANELTLPSGIKLRCSVHPESEYPCINIDLLDPEGKPVRLCFVEHNPEKRPGQELCIGVYCSAEEDTVYYDSYYTEDAGHI